MTSNSIINSSGLTSKGPIVIKNEKRQNSNVEYRDGIKSKGDKIGMPCTHSTLICDTRNS